MLNLHADDDCCSGALSKALASGALDSTDEWTCPKCGCEWRAGLPVDEHGYEFSVISKFARYWAPHEHIEVIAL